MNSDIKYYLTVFWRRMPLFLAVFLSISAVAMTLAIMLPTVYTSRAKLLVESAQIPDELASSTVQVNASEQLEIIQQRLMTRTTLIEIARDLNVFEELGQMNPDQIVEQMRIKTHIKSTSGRDRATLLELAFDGRTPQISAGVVNEYVTRVLDENVRLRTSKAEDTLDFFEQEVERLGSELDLQSSRILEFQNANADALPDSLDYRLSRQTLVQERIAQIGRDVITLDDQRRRLIQVFEATGQLQSESQTQLTPEQKQLNELRDQLAAALAIYSEENPNVKVLRARVNQMEEVVRAQTVIGNTAEAEVSLLDLQLAEIDSRKAALEEQATLLEGELEKLDDSIRRTPSNSIVLDGLKRDYDNVQLQYNAAVERLSKAATGERIELLSKGQRIAIIEQATAPTVPTSPNRPLIAAGGTFGGLTVALGLILLLEMLNKSVRRPADLSKALNITPLATIPYIRTKGERLRRRSFILVALMLLAAGIPVALYLVHSFYLPIDLILTRLMERVGL
ncbi:GumC family protein [Actibacterium lipolyticum]|uniref:Cryptic autophosphorylating protein tyrosine kinase Etk n=1 Tax=Actibacterium lipolyticum TaxID=1524263 RepID=A0A238KUZ5_9RHOB|nr:hypothetical protein [Actibacterium lipolyticum]SMX46460.1 cryptic autophosphorylating protein tyrosine kinase Etk [Actibacterium lipolyticum]